MSGELVPIIPGDGDDELHAVCACDPPALTVTFSAALLHEHVAFTCPFCHTTFEFLPAPEDAA